LEADEAQMFVDTGCFFKQEQPISSGTVPLGTAIRGGGSIGLLSLWLVLPLSVVDNSDFSANRLTALETLLMLASQGAYQAPHFKQW